MPRLLQRLSYAKVMSTLAVFLFIGGTAAAVSKISGSQLRNHSVTGKKLKNNTITGKQVNESTLGKVPSAVHADSADNATNANHATTADSATNADNATTLNHLHSFDFESATTVLDGQGTSNSTNTEALFNALGVGATLTTDGDNDTHSQLLLRNNNSSGNIIGTVFTTTGPPTAFGVPAGTAQEIGPATGTGTDTFDTLIEDAGSPSRAMWIHCLFNFQNGIPTVWCWGIST